MLTKVNLALRITTSAFDEELNDLIAAAQQDLGIAGVIVPEELDAIVSTAITTYCKLHFGEKDDWRVYERLKASYDEQKAQLSMATGYTEWIDQT